MGIILLSGGSRHLWVASGRSRPALGYLMPLVRSSGRFLLSWYWVSLSSAKSVSKLHDIWLQEAMEESQPNHWRVHPTIYDILILKEAWSFTWFLFTCCVLHHRRWHIRVWHQYSGLAPKVHYIRCNLSFNWGRHLNHARHTAGRDIGVTHHHCCLLSSCSDRWVTLTNHKSTKVEKNHKTTKVEKKYNSVSL